MSNERINQNMDVTIDPEHEWIPCYPTQHARMLRVELESNYDKPEQEKPMFGPEDDDPDSLPAPNDGWMPTGTYLPTSTEDWWGHGERSRVKMRAIDPKLDPSERGPGIAKTIPTYARRFPSRTTCWSNAGDDYDLLGDA